MFVEAAQSDLPGLIFTMMWAFDLPGELRFVEKQKSRFEAHGGRAVFVELQASLETRILRNETELRLSSKPSKRNVAGEKDACQKPPVDVNNSRLFSGIQRQGHWSTSAGSNPV